MGAHAFAVRLESGALFRDPRKQGNRLVQPRPNLSTSDEISPWFKEKLTIRVEYMSQNQMVRPVLSHLLGSGGDSERIVPRVCPERLHFQECPQKWYAACRK